MSTVCTRAVDGRLHQGQRGVAAGGQRGFEDVGSHVCQVLLRQSNLATVCQTVCRGDSGEKSFSKS